MDVEARYKEGTIVASLVTFTVVGEAFARMGRLFWAALTPSRSD